MRLWDADVKVLHLNKTSQMNTTGIYDIHYLGIHDQNKWDIKYSYQGKESIANFIWLIGNFPVEIISSSSEEFNKWMIQWNTGPYPYVAWEFTKVDNDVIEIQQRIFNQIATTPEPLINCLLQYIKELSNIARVGRLYKTARQYQLYHDESNAVTLKENDESKQTTEIEELKQLPETTIIQHNPITELRDAEVIKQQNGMVEMIAMQQKTISTRENEIIELKKRVTEHNLDIQRMHDADQEKMRIIMADLVKQAANANNTIADMRRDASTSNAANNNIQKMQATELKRTQNILDILKTQEPVWGNIIASIHTLSNEVKRGAECKLALNNVIEELEAKHKLAMKVDSNTTRKIVEHDERFKSDDELKATHTLAIRALDIKHGEIIELLKIQSASKKSDGLSLNDDVNKLLDQVRSMQQDIKVSVESTGDTEALISTFRTERQEMQSKMDSTSNTMKEKQTMMLTTMNDLRLILSQTDECNKTLEKTVNELKTEHHKEIRRYTDNCDRRVREAANQREDATIQTSADCQEDMQRKHDQHITSISLTHDTALRALESQLDSMKDTYASHLLIHQQGIDQKNTELTNLKEIMLQQKVIIDSNLKVSPSDNPSPHLTKVINEFTEISAQLQSYTQGVRSSTECDNKIALRIQSMQADQVSLTNKCSETLEKTVSTLETKHLAEIRRYTDDFDMRVRQVMDQKDSELTNLKEIMLQHNPSPHFTKVINEFTEQLQSYTQGVGSLTACDDKREDKLSQTMTILTTSLDKTSRYQDEIMQMFSHAGQSGNIPMESPELKTITELLTSVQLELTKYNQVGITLSNIPDDQKDPVPAIVRKTQDNESLQEVVLKLNANLVNSVKTVDVQMLEKKQLQTEIEQLKSRTRNLNIEIEREIKKGNDARRNAIAEKQSLMSKHAEIVDNINVGMEQLISDNRLKIKAQQQEADVKCQTKLTSLSSELYSVIGEKLSIINELQKTNKQCMEEKQAWLPKQKLLNAVIEETTHENEKLQRQRLEQWALHKEQLTELRAKEWQTKNKAEEIYDHARDLIMIMQPYTFTVNSEDEEKWSIYKMSEHTTPGESTQMWVHSAVEEHQVEENGEDEEEDDEDEE